MDSYVIADDSPVHRVTVDDKKLVLGGDPVDLNKSQLERVESVGTKLTKSTKAASSGDTSNS